ncbi:MAG: DUF167 domain-containing protein [Thermincola sp.]|nr:DUF167 domain-containing protein [Thermincola sp.]MDT3704066.1 DUF167 domain-containing protein [Thermincola sp.]
MFYQEHPDGVVLKIKVQPRASKSRIAGVLGDALKVTLTAPPVDGAANAACIEFFSRLIGIPKNRIEIVSGQTGRTKLIKIFGINSADLREKIDNL